MNTKSLRKILIRVIAIGVPLALAAFLLLMQKQFRDIRELRRQVEVSIAIRNDLQTLLSEHIDAETGQRGYVLTGDRQFLEPYFSGRAKIEQTLASLRTYSAGDPELRRSLPDLADLSKRVMAFSAGAIATYRNDSAARARVLPQENDGKLLMDSFRQRIAKLDAVEQTRLEKVTTSRDRTRVQVERTFYALFVAFVILFLSAFVVTARVSRDRKRQFERANELGEQRQAILDGTVDGLLVLDENGNMLEINASIERLFGYSAEDLVGRHNTFLMAEPPPREVSLAWLRTVGTAGRDGAGQRMDFTGRRKDDTIFETSVAVSRIASPDTPRYVAIISDVTERRRVERMKTEFVSTVSHELRTPLTSIGGSLSLLAGGAVGPLSDKAARLVTIAHNNCERLIRLINDILDIEKMESGAMHFDMRRKRVNSLIERVVTANAQYADSYGVTLRSEVPPWPLMIEGDPDRLDQLLTNLLSNAIKHSPSGGEVCVVAMQNGSNARIEVCDRGGGIPEDFRDRIFGKFAMADSSDSRTGKGTGLGLSIAREIAIRHNGTIGFEDRPGGGTTFFFELPLICEDSQPKAVEENGLPRIIHIDDDQDCLDVVASAFEGKAAIVSVSTLSEARNVLRNGNYAAAIVDVGLKSENGLELVPELRAAVPDIPVLLFTAIDGAYREGDVDKVVVKSRSSLDALVEETMRAIASGTRSQPT